MLVVVPALALGLLELALRMAGYGYSPSFFVRRQINGQAMLVENSQFGWRFFPPALARTPTPVAIRAVKPAGVYRIFLFGESAALGDPRPAYGAGRYLEALLRERYPGTEFEVVCAAMTAINSHAIVPIARECARYQGDLWIVYAGNNEYIGPFGPNTVFGPSTLPLVTVRAYLALQETRAGQFLVALARKFTGSAAPKAGWSGLKMFQENQIAPGDPRRRRVEESFRRNLADIVRAGVRSGVPVILSGMASNLRDCAPFGSLHTPLLGASELGDWEKLCQTGATNAAQGNWTAAAKACQEAVRRSPHYAELQFRLGQAWLGLTNFTAASQCFREARDLDALPFRADSKLNAAAEQVSHGQKGVVYLDAEKALARLSPDQIPGLEFFYEHVHLNFDGNYQLARLWAEQVLTWLPASITRAQTADWAEADVCARRLGLTDWNRYSVLEEIFRRLLEAPYTSQFNHAQQLKQLMSQLAEVKERLHPRGFMDARAAFDEAIHQRPQDYWLHQNYAEFLEAAGDLAAASAQWEIVRDLLPHHHVAYFQAGRLLSRQKKYDEGRNALEAALRLRPDLAEAYLELGQIHANQRKWVEALQQYDAAERCRPGDARVYLRRAEVLAAQTKRVEAIQCMRDAIKLRPSYWEARYLLGVELAVDGKLAEAQTQFEEVVRLRPDHALAHFNLGVALAKQNRTGEALVQFQETLQRDPEHKQARQYLEALESLAPKRP